MMTPELTVLALAGLLQGLRGDRCGIGRQAPLQALQLGAGVGVLGLQFAQPQVHRLLVGTHQVR